MRTAADHWFTDVRNGVLWFSQHKTGGFSRTCKSARGVSRGADGEGVPQKYTNSTRAWAEVDLRKFGVSYTRGV